MSLCNRTGSARRFRRAPRTVIAGRAVPVATSLRLRLLGLALLSQRQAGEGLLIPRCRSVHTFGMRFRTHVAFLDAELKPIAMHGAVPAGRVFSDRRAAAVLELPVAPGET